MLASDREESSNLVRLLDLEAEGTGEGEENGRDPLPRCWLAGVEEKGGPLRSRKASEMA